MTIQASAQAHPIVAPSVGLAFCTTDSGEKCFLTNNARIALQQMHDFIVNMNRLIPCNASMASNVITLTLLPSQPSVTQYTSYDGFAYVQPADTTGAVTALVVTETGTLPTLNVYKNTGTQAGSGDLKANGLYRLFFNDALNGGSGGLVIDGNAATTFTALTNSTGGVVSTTIAAVSGTPDDTHINNNFASLTSRINAIAVALGLS